jgi:nucleotide-binding universal stress UspA family protein
VACAPRGDIWGKKKRKVSTLPRQLRGGHPCAMIVAKGDVRMRKFLVVLDDSRECLNAMRFAAMRAARTGGGVEILSVIPPEEFNHWIGVGDIMREEARERIHAHFEVFAKWMRDKQGVDPELVIREGEPVTEILAQIAEDKEIGVLVLGAGTDKGGPGPLVTQLSRSAGSLSVPITIVPGDLSKERLEAIT